MIAGVVRGNEGRIRVRVKGPTGQIREVEAVLDTGYTASLTLPPDLIVSLGLRWKTFGLVVLGDGSEHPLDVYEGEIFWDGKLKRVLVDETATTPLVGMGLLRGFELKMQVRARGKVAIKRLRNR